MTIKEFFKNDRYAIMSGIELLEAREGYARSKMPVKDMHLNAGEIVQGGAIFTLADLTFGAAVNSYGKATVSIETSIRIFKSTTAGDTLYAEAQEIHLHPKLATFEVRVSNNAGDLIALFTATGYRKSMELKFDAEE
jgi:acyl-CoA thioesterase